MTKKPLAACGTNAAYNRHISHHETPCPPCKAAHSAYQTSHRPEPLGEWATHTVDTSCGTEGGYALHLRTGETPCDQCKGEHAFTRGTPSARANTRLRHIYLAEYAEILADETEYPGTSNSPWKDHA